MPSLTAGPRFSEECVSRLSLFAGRTAGEASLFADSLFSPSHRCQTGGAAEAPERRAWSTTTGRTPKIFPQLAKVAHIPEPSARMCVFRAKVNSGGSSWNVSRCSDTLNAFDGSSLMEWNPEANRQRWFSLFSHRCSE